MIIIIIIDFIDNKREVITDLCVIHNMVFSLLYSTEYIDLCSTNYIYTDIYHLQNYIQIAQRDNFIHTHTYKHRYRVSCRIFLSRYTYEHGIHNQVGSNISLIHIFTYLLNIK